MREIEGPRDLHSEALTKAGVVFQDIAPLNNIIILKDHPLTKEHIKPIIRRVVPASIIPIDEVYLRKGREIK